MNDNEINSISAKHDTNTMLKIYYYTLKRKLCVRINDSMISEIDSIGFNILHYAILNNNVKVIQNIMRKKELLPKPIINDKRAMIYDYSFLATYLGYPQIATLVIDASPYLAAITNCKKILENKLYLANSSIIAYNQEISVYNRLIRTCKDINRKKQLRNKIEQCKISIVSRKKYVENIMCDLAEIKIEIARLTEIYNENIKWLREYIQNVKAPYIDYLLQIYKNPTEIENILKTEEADRIIYYFGGNPVSIPNRIYKLYFEQRTNHYEKETYEEKKSGIEYGKKPYGNHWFSDAAYGDIDLLRKEYHILVKMYHPDNECPDVNIFIEIQQERAYILDNMK